MRLRRLKRNRPAAGAFEAELALEILKSDRLRVTILICAFGVVLPVILVLARLHELRRKALTGRRNRYLSTCITTSRRKGNYANS